ncbi:YeeE/YedE thiosulfate transporter family protein [Azospirillum rugosum]|uniref:Membrane protein YedE/YeeE n=1 Tax=Azospirillum rugosum TaxID=416170 RepID=A0ABS4SL90_9PROT|nr:YeeE/YedE thiosulfate transporter family protein [Azospirillum rugosum]MBP2293319.1 putative membrane protein YedE/YeeE [Azospirillum rugosum]
MSVLGAVGVGLLMGMVFGFALEKSRVFEPGMIIGQFQFRNFIMLKIFLTAVTTGLVVLAVLNGLDLVKLSPKATLFAADVGGGLLLGAGIALAGACPGTVAAQIGAGYRDAIGTLVGGIAGAALFIHVQPVLEPLILTGGPGKLRVDVALDMPYWVTALAFAVVWVVVLVALEKWRPWRVDLGADHDGLGVPPALGGGANVPDGQDPLAVGDFKIGLRRE